MKFQKWMWIAWPAFLVAGVLEMLVFAMVDPQDLHWFGQPVELSRQGVYTVTFFIFWGVTAMSSALTCLLAASPFEINQCPLPAGSRPDGCPKQEGCSVERGCIHGAVASGALSSGQPLR